MLVLTTYDYEFVMTEEHGGQGAGVWVARESYPPTQLQPQSDGNRDIRARQAWAPILPPAGSK